jgi:hypothetical protein
LVHTKIDAALIERAREALSLDDTIPAGAIVRKALIDAIGDEHMNYIVKQGRPAKSDA